MKKVKVSTREVVVVAVMLVAVLFGVSDFFLASSSKVVGVGGGEDAARIDALIADVSKVLEDSKSCPVYAAIVTEAETDWGRDLSYADNTPVVSTSNLGPVEYTGYLEIGTRRIGIIDGVSYEAGDELEVGGYLVKRIRPSSVMIEEKGTGKSITVPLLEE
ncbi:MAG: hypothetical protein E4H15_01570 [Syntrophobacterales bacterium]|nr:MAG: hypothetical protein E4H15_01570 [Syntrophobacterales bacterium]